MTQMAILFPGQGSQEVGMGRDLAEANPEVMELWKKAERISGIRLREIYWDGDEAHMADTKNLQPALTVANLGVWVAMAGKLAPSAVAGHSLGEYAALGAAGVLPFDTLLELVALRGKLMSQADPSGNGAMAAIVKLSAEEVAACIEETRPAANEILVVANYNTPAQTVVSGSKSAIERMQGVVKEHKGRAIPLAVSGAFHSPLMQEAAKEMEVALNAISKSAWQHAKFPVYPNANPSPITDFAAIHKLLAVQMTSSVHWVPTVRNQFTQGVRLFVECGPKNVLSKMVDPILTGFAGEKTEPPLWESKNIGTLEQVKEWA